MGLWVKGDLFPLPQTVCPGGCTVPGGALGASLVWGKMCRTVGVDFGVGQTRRQILHSPWHLGQVTGKNLTGLRNACDVLSMCPAPSKCPAAGVLLWAAAQPGHLGQPSTPMAASRNDAMEPFWGSGCPFLPSASPQGTFGGAFRAGENPASWMGVQVGAAAKENKALRPMFSA